MHKKCNSFCKKQQKHMHTSKTALKRLWKALQCEANNNLCMVQFLIVLNSSFLILHIVSMFCNGYIAPIW